MVDEFTLLQKSYVWSEGVVIEHGRKSVFVLFSLISKLITLLLFSLMVDGCQRSPKLRHTYSSMTTVTLGHQENHNDSWLPDSMTRDDNLSSSLEPTPFCLESVQLPKVKGTRTLTQICCHAQQLSNFWFLIFSQWILNSNDSESGCSNNLIRISSRAADG